MKPLDKKCILITGGTGSLGKKLIHRILSAEMGRPNKIIVFSRDEAKQHQMRVDYLQKIAVTDEVIYQNFKETLVFQIGDVRDLNSIIGVLQGVDIVINAAALKQVPACEYAPFEAVQTNVLGADNIVKAIQQHKLPVETVVGVSTDKACKPVNVMGMTKAIQERIFIQANLRCLNTRFVCVRYGNVLASRGSVIPLFHEQIRNGGPVTITTSEMTRFLISLDEAVDTIFAAIKEGLPGETYIPRVPSSLMTHIAKALIGLQNIDIKTVGIRPGEKVHEILIGAEEANRTVERGKWYAVLPMLPELVKDKVKAGVLSKEYSSEDNVMTLEETLQLLKDRKLMLEDADPNEGELLR